MQLPKIHFVALASVDNDSDMLPFFMAHYNDMRLGNYCLFLHEGKDPSANKWAGETCAKLGWNFRFIPHASSYNSGHMRHVLVSKYLGAIKAKGDYIITADVDELQEWPEPPLNAIRNGFDLVLGKTVDHYNTKLLPPDYGNPIDATYPYTHDNLSSVIFPKRPRNVDKIVMARVTLPVDYKRSTRIVGEQKFRVSDGVTVHNYKWREGLLKKISTKPDYLPEEVEAIKNFFA